MNQYRVRRDLVEGCNVAQFLMGSGSVSVQCGSVQGAVWLSKVRRGSVRVRHGSVLGAT
jgi:hypothetical protein